MPAASVSTSTTAKFSSIARCQIGGAAYINLYGLRYLAQGFIPGLMAVTVIESLEMVDINHDQ